MMPTERSNAQFRGNDPITPMSTSGSTTTGTQQQPLTTIQRIVRLAEKDDVLLYATALFGIFMPAVMYFFYRTMHAKYHNYQRKKEIAKQKKMARKKNRRTVTIFYCGTETLTKRMAYDLAEELDRFDPVVANLSAVDIGRRIKQSAKAVFIFIVHSQSNDNFTPLLSTFMDWLDEIRYEHRQKAFFASVTYAIFSVDFSTSEVVQKPNIAELLHNKLRLMKGTPIYNSPTTVSSDKATTSLQEFSVDLTRILKQFYCGAFEEPMDHYDDDSESDDTMINSDDTER